LKEPCVKEAEVAIVTEDHVVANGNAEQPAALHQLASDLSIGGRGCGIPAGVIMHENDCGAVGQDRRGQELLVSRFRVVAATQRDLERMVEEGLFRQDLLFRLGMARIRLAPLRDRAEDIPALASEFLRAYRSGNPGAHPTHITREGLALLKASRWPGNVRELLHVVEAAAAVAEGRPR
jgi:transcriptional regulator with GAF, ATPase, and Fis domain